MNIAELYPKYFDEIARYARTFARDRAAAEDVAQESFMRALRNSPLLAQLPERKVRAWLYTTARRIAIDQARSRRREEDAPLREDHSEDDLSFVMVQGLLSALSEEDRMLVQMRHFADLNSAEIGEMLGIPAATVRTRLRGAVKRLRELYDRQ